MAEPPRSRLPRRRNMLPALLLLGLAYLTQVPTSHGEDENAGGPPAVTPPPAGSGAEKHRQPAPLIRMRSDAQDHALTPEWMRALKPRRAHPKKTPSSPPGNAHRLVVKFADSLNVRVDHDGILTVGDGNPAQIAALNSLAEVLQLRFRPLHSASEDSLTALRTRAALRTGKQQPDPLCLVEVLPKDGSPDAVLATAKALLPLDTVEYAEIQSMDTPPPPPAADLLPATPSLVSYQTYRQPTQGIGVDYVWNLLGTRGHSSLRVTDCEYSFNPQHEDLSGLITLQAGVGSMYNAFGDDHGTAATGVLAAADNDYGMSGSIPGCQIHFYPEYATMSWGYLQSRTAAVTAAIAASAAGDIVMLEMQSWGPNGSYGPAEYDTSIWDAVRMGTDAGVIILAAAGNGGQNLDGSAWSEYRGRGDSGAIIVGAGSPSRSCLSYSNHGSRIDLQGWGSGVATTGFGKLATFGEDPNQKYTSSFNGTSSATPIVASAAALVQSVAIERLGMRLTPDEMRSLLIATGKPQTGSTSTPIGPLPDLTAAVPQLLAAEFSSAAAISIPDSGEASPFPSAIHVSGVDGTVSSVRVRINGLNHSNPRNLDLLLVGPDGQVVSLMSDAGSYYGVTNTSLTFDDTAPTLIPDTAAIVPGRYQPANYGSPLETPPPGTTGPIGTNLNALAANGANGDWKLYVIDDFAEDSGSIDSWSVSFETPPTVSLAAASNEVSEDGAPVSVTATLSKITPVEVTVPITLSGSATMFEDFTVTSAPIIIPAGQTSGCVTITPADDATDENDETIIVSMGVPIHAAAGTITGQTITILDNDVILNVVSTYGGPSPGSTSQTYTSGSMASVSVTPSCEEGATRHCCNGWSGTGSVPPEGTGSFASFCIRENSSITWNWETEHLLEVLTSGDGTVNGTSGWHMHGTTVTLSASPAAGHHFAGWTVSPGSLVIGNTNQTQITVALDGPVSVTANFPPTPPALLGFINWATNAGLAGPDAEPSAIPYGGTTPNLLKYAFNLDPGGPDSHTLVPGSGTTGLPCLTCDSSSDPPVFRLEYVRRKFSGLVYSPLEMTDPGYGPHSPMTGTTRTLEIDADWDRVVIEQPLDPEHPRRFFMVAVEVPDIP